MLSLENFLVNIILKKFMIRKSIILIVLKIFDYYHNKKMLAFLQKKISRINILLDIGAHQGESLNLFVNNLGI